MKNIFSANQPIGSPVVNTITTVSNRDLLGCQVKAKPQNGENTYILGTVISQRKDQIYIQFANLDQRLSNWYNVNYVIFVNPRYPEFKIPDISDIRNIEYLVFGNMLIKCWYFSPYPPPFNKLKTLFVCPRCLRYGTVQYGIKHSKICVQTSPPGLKIYDDQVFRFYEIDGRTEKLFCQFLCLFTRLFLDSKSLYYNTDWFLFYVLTVKNSEGEHICGYFSKEKTESNVLSCILTFPTFMQKGIGFHLIDFAYMLARVENRIAGPEEPLSDLGEKSFMKYWKHALIKNICERADCYYGRTDATQRYEEEESVVTTVSEQMSPRTKKQNQFLFVDLKDVSGDSSILLKHIIMASEEIGFRVRRGNEVGVSYLQHKYFCQWLSAQQKGGYYNKYLNMKYLQWEPYPCMFCGPRE